jgi:hypothetical protein
LVYNYTPQNIIAQAERVVRIVTIYLKAGSFIPVQSGIGANPYDTVAVLG